MRIISEQELKDILDKHGKWIRNEGDGERADLGYANLSYADLSYVNLSSVNLGYANLSSANLRSANLSSADLRSADLSYADLSYANLSSANLRSANLSSANLRSANLRSADLSYANLMVFQFQKHQAYYTFDGMLRIGCNFHKVEKWLKDFKAVGVNEGYTPVQIRMYGCFIKTCAIHQKSLKK